MGTVTKNVAKGWALAAANLYPNKEMTMPLIEESNHMWPAKVDNGGKFTSEPWQSLRSVVKRKPAGQPAEMRHIH